MSLSRSSCVVVSACLLALCTLPVAAPVAASAEIVERVVAVVNDDAIFLSELRRRAGPFLEQVAADPDANERKAHIKKLYDHFLSELVDEQLIQQTARKMNINVSSVDVDQAIENVRNQNTLSTEQFWEAVKGQGFTEKQYREDVRKQLLRLKVTNQRVRSRVNISEDTVKDEYDDRVRSARRRQRFHAEHLFLPLAATASATEVVKAMKSAQELKKGLSPETFEAVMNAHGGGDLGWLDQGDLPEDLENALLALEPGQISEPVRGPSGVHVFWLRERQAGGISVPPFAQAKETIYRELLDKQMAKQQDLFLAELRRAAVIDLKP